MNKLSSSAGLRKVISIIGNRNAGKSSLLNALLEQDVSIVSSEKGTTTDAVLKNYELIPVGPVSFYDTAGIDDVGELGDKRVKATQKAIKKSDLIIFVVGKEGLTAGIANMMRSYQLSGISFIPVFNFADEIELDNYHRGVMHMYDGIAVSAKTGVGIEDLRQKIIEKISQLEKDPKLVIDLIKPHDIVVLVTPIDEASPKGRMILPQVQVLRELLDGDAVVLVTKETELKDTLLALKNKPQLVITDSQAVKEVVALVPDDVNLTTFSMLFARAKGNFKQMLDGASVLNELPENSRILIAEGCSHHITCNDIGRVKIPNLIKNRAGKEFVFEFLSGSDFPEDLSGYDLVIHCGGCMLNRKEVQERMRQCAMQGVAVTNYGMVISWAQGVFDRAVKVLR